MTGFTGAVTALRQLECFRMIVPAGRPLRFASAPSYPISGGSPILGARYIRMHRAGIAGFVILRAERLERPGEQESSATKGSVMASPSQSKELKTPSAYVWREISAQELCNEGGETGATLGWVIARPSLS